MTVLMGGVLVYYGDDAYVGHHQIDPDDPVLDAAKPGETLCMVSDTRGVVVWMRWSDLHAEHRGAA